jgi:hypothetical protein
MLDFFLIGDEQSCNSNQMASAGGINLDEFERAQDLKIIEKHVDFYDDFRWASQSVHQKHALLTPAVTGAIPSLASILKQAFAADCGLAAFGD